VVGRFVGLRHGGGLTALCHVGANVVPSGEGCGAFATRTRGQIEESRSWV
jgi:hypothetical protein